MQQKEVLITAGGTQERIDDVRYIGNFSSGRFGLALAQEYTHDHRVTLLAPTATVERFGLPENVQHIPFTSTQSLADAMLARDIADLVFHAAAVSDFTPQKIDGKLSSDLEDLTVKLLRTPKILPLLRPHFGPDAILVGFKLLSGVSNDHLSSVGFAQTEHNSTDYCIANRLEDIDSRSGNRTVQCIESNGTITYMSGKTERVANQLRVALSGAVS